MARVTVEDCLEQVPNRFALTILAAERGRQISKGAPPLVRCENKSAVTALPDGTFVAYDASAFDTAPFPTMRVVPEEAGAHVVCLGGGSIVMAASAPRSAELFDDLGFDVFAVDIGEFEKREGCVTCLSVLVGKRVP